MFRLLADENFDRRILEGLLTRRDDLDIQRVRDVGLLGAPDLVVLTWAAAEDRILLTHDLKTMPPFAHERIERGLRIGGVIAFGQRLAIGRAIDEILVVLECTREDEWQAAVIRLPL